MPLKQIKVVAAIILHDNKILATQRGYGEFENGWEFPGGKVEQNESPEQALKREIREELQLDIHVEDFLLTVEHDYENFHLSMDCFVCSMASENITLVEHHAAQWLSAHQLDSLNWLPADIAVVEKIKATHLLS